MKKRLSTVCSKLFVKAIALSTLGCGANFLGVSSGTFTKAISVKSDSDKKIALEGTKNELSFFYKMPKTSIGLGGYVSNATMTNKFKAQSDQSEVMEITALGFRGTKQLAGPFLLDLGIGGHQSTLKIDPGSDVNHRYSGGGELTLGFSFAPCISAICLFLRAGFNYSSHSNGKDLNDSTATLRQLDSSGLEYSIGVANWWGK